MFKYVLAALAGLILLATIGAGQHPLPAPAPVAQTATTTVPAATTSPAHIAITSALPPPVAPVPAPKPAPVAQPAATPSTAPTHAPTPAQSSGTVAYGVRTKTSGCTANQALPDCACSPGDVLTTDTSIVCVSGYTQTVRNVPDSEKQAVFAEYGIPWSEHANYEVDHIISLELGGSNDISNLFPESYLIQYNAHVKDGLENHLHSLVCSGALPIATAQAEISSNWVQYYLAWKGGAEPPAPTVTTTATTQPAPAPTTAPSAAAYYTSSYHSAQYYYPASCSAWKNLSSTYLKSFATLQDLLSAYPSRTLSPQC